MKTSEVLFVMLFGLGVMGRVMKLPFGALIMAVGALAFLVSQIIAVAQSKEKGNGWLGLATACWMFYFLTAVKFLSPISDWTLSFAAMCTTVTIWINIKASRLKFSTKAIVLSVLLAGCTVISIMPKHELYYWSSIHFNHDISTDYCSLDKYSRYLSRAKEFDRAITYNGKAIHAAKKAVAMDLTDQKELIRLMQYKSELLNQKIARKP